MSVEPVAPGPPPPSPPPGSAAPAAPDRVIPEWARPALGSDLGVCLARLDEAIEFAAALNVPIAAATTVRNQVLARMGFPADVYTLALVGGTGVGKSSLLNALAGGEVSTVSVRRPTTSHPVAWVPAASRSQLAGLLDHLEVGEVRLHADQALGSVAVLDLPDMDSVADEHRERVEALLPRVDAVLWVTDLEKYRDAVLHDVFLRGWIDRLDRQLVVLNKADRLAIDDAERVRRDLQTDLNRLLGDERSGPAVILASATAEGRNGPGVTAVRSWLAQGVEAKAIVRARLAASIVAGIGELAATAGVDPATEVAPIVEGAAREAAAGRAADAVLRVVDLPGVEEQVIAATRARARSKGSGPLGRATAWISRRSGRDRQIGDPIGFLGRWRERGSLSAAVAAVRDAVVEPISRAPAAVRPALAGTIEPDRLETALAGAIDRAVGDPGATLPSSRIWSILGVLQTLTTVIVLFSLGWLVLLVALRSPVDELVLPGLGRVPIPFVLLVAGLLAGFLLGRLLTLHAGFLGRRWARRLAGDIRSHVGREVGETAFAPLDWVETVQRGLWTAARSARQDCRERTRR
ncbi:MAG TPA: GTPase [Candidatus Limnocylindrales bacterium]